MSQYTDTSWCDLRISRDDQLDHLLRRGVRVGRADPAAGQRRVDMEKALQAALDRVAGLERDLQAARGRISELEASAEAQSMTGGKRDLYRRVGLSGASVPWFVVQAAHRAYRIALHPDRHPPHRQQAAHDRYVTVEAIFAEILATHDKSA